MIWYLVSNHRHLHANSLMSIVCFLTDNNYYLHLLSRYLLSTILLLPGLVFTYFVDSAKENMYFSVQETPHQGRVFNAIHAALLRLTCHAHLCKSSFWSEKLQSH